VIPRNARLLEPGYCGMGCPVNAKQSMLVTSIPALLEKGDAAVPGPRRALQP
jgi:hypothetical protein